LPGSGILAAYTDAATGELNDQFPNALAMYLWAWFILTVIFTVAAMRSSWVLFLDLFFLDIVLLLLACGYMLNMPKLETAGSALGFVVAILSCMCLLAISYSIDADEINRLGWHGGAFCEWNHTVQYPSISHVYGEVD